MRSPPALLMMMLVLTSESAYAQSESAHRVASLNLCVDEMLVTLADPASIASLSPLAGDPALSRVAALARRFTNNRGSAEEIVHETPDLVIAVAGVNMAAQTMLRRLGVRLETVPLVNRLDQIAPVFRRVAALVGAEARGESLLAEMNQRLDLLRAAPGSRGSVLVYEASGWTDGSGTMWDDLMTLAGFTNQAALLGRVGYGKLSMEQVITAPPHFLVTQPYARDQASLAEAWLDHPALRHMGSIRIELSAHLFCGTPAVTDAIEQLVSMTEPKRAAP